MPGAGYRLPGTVSTFGPPLFGAPTLLAPPFLTLTFSGFGPGRPASLRAAGLAQNDPREAQTAHFGWTMALNRCTIPQEDPKEEKKERNSGRKRGKKARHFDPVGAHNLLPHLLAPLFWAPPSLTLTFFRAWAPRLRSPPAFGVPNGLTLGQVPITGYRVPGVGCSLLGAF